MKGFEPFKGRTAPQIGECVRVHRNLNRRDAVWWSITVNRLVVGHALEVTLADADPIINETAADRIAAGANREVHAWVEGTIADEPDWMTDTILAPVTYSPHHGGRFYYRFQPETRWHGASVVSFSQKGMRA